MTLHAFVTLILKNLGLPEPEVDEDEKYDFVAAGNRKVSIYTKRKKIILSATIDKPLSVKDEDFTRNLLRDLLEFKLKTMRIMNEILGIEEKTPQLFAYKPLDPDTIDPQNAWDIFEDFIINLEIIEERFFSKTQKIEAIPYPGILS